MEYLKGETYRKQPACLTSFQLIPVTESGKDRTESSQNREKTKISWTGNNYVWSKGKKQNRAKEKIDILWLFSVLYRFEFII